MDLRMTWSTLGSRGRPAPVDWSCDLAVDFVNESLIQMLVSFRKGRRLRLL